MGDSSTLQQLLTAVAESAGDFDPPDPRMFDDRARRRRRLSRVVTATMTAVAMVVATVIVVRETRTESARVITSPTAPPGSVLKPEAVTAEELTRGHWTELPPAPIPDRGGAAAVWTGKEMLVWGGHSGAQGATLHADGAAYDPGEARWRVLPPAPISARHQHAAVWTGKEMIVWGGYDNVAQAAFHVTNDGAAFDPDRQSWRKLPPSPIQARAGANAVWTGKEMIVVGGYPAVRTDTARGFTDAAAYDPRSNRWRVLPPLPLVQGHDVEDTIVLWVGSRLLVWTRWSHREPRGNTVTGNAGIDLSTYDPSENLWRQPPDAAGAPSGIEAPIWTGREVIVPASQPWGGGFPSPPRFGLAGSRYDIASNSWRPMQHGPVDDTQGPSFWTGAALMRLSTSIAGSVQPGDDAAWDHQTDRWVALPRAPEGSTYESVGVWTGREVLLWGQLFDPAAQNRVVTAGLRFGF